MHFSIALDLVNDLSELATSSLPPPPPPLQQRSELSSAILLLSCHSTNQRIFLSKKNEKEPLFLFYFRYVVFVVVCVDDCGHKVLHVRYQGEREREEGADRFWLITIQTAITTRVDPPLIRRKMNDKKFDEEMTCDQPSMPRLAYLQDIVRLQSNRKHNIVAFLSIFFPFLNWEFDWKIQQFFFQVIFYFRFLTQSTEEWNHSIIIVVFASFRLSPQGSVTFDKRRRNKNWRLGKRIDLRQFLATSSQTLLMLKRSFKQPGKERERKREKNAVESSPPLFIVGTPHGRRTA